MQKLINREKNIIIDKIVQKLSNSNCVNKLNLLSHNYYINVFYIFIRTYAMLFFPPCRLKINIKELSIRCTSQFL